MSRNTSTVSLILGGTVAAALLIVCCWTCRPISAPARFTSDRELYEALIGLDEGQVVERLGEPDLKDARPVGFDFKSWTYQQSPLAPKVLLVLHIKEGKVDTVVLQKK